MLGLHKEGIQRVEEALEIFERLNNVSGQAHSLQLLASLLYADKQLDAAEEAALRTIELLSDQGDQFTVCDCYATLGNICGSRGEVEKAVNYFEMALGIASSSNWLDLLFWINYSLAELFLGENRFDDAHTHVGRAKSHIINSSSDLDRAKLMRLQAKIWHKERKLEEAKSEALRAADALEKLGATKSLEICRELLQDIENEMKT